MNESWTIHVRGTPPVAHSPRRPPALVWVACLHQRLSDPTGFVPDPVPHKIISSMPSPKHKGTSAMMTATCLSVEQGCGGRTGTRKQVHSHVSRAPRLPDHCRLHNRDGGVRTGSALHRRQSAVKMRLRSLTGRPFVPFLRRTRKQ